MKRKAKKFDMDKRIHWFKIVCNKYRREIKIIKRRNLQRKNLIRQQVYRDLSHEKLGNMLKNYLKKIQVKCLLIKNGVEAKTDLGKLVCLSNIMKQFTKNGWILSLITLLSQIK